MRSLVLLPLASVFAFAACGGDDDPPVAGACVPDVALYGEFLDWDALTGAFVGIGGAVWTVDGEATRTATSAPNGRVELCVEPGGRTHVAIAAPDPYLDGHYVADANLFASGTATFAQYGATRAQLEAQYTAFGGGLTFDATKAHLLVEVKGQPGTPTLSGATAAAVRYFTAGKTWDAAGPGSYALFINVAPGTGTVAMPGAAGGGTVPLAAGAWTMTTLVSGSP